jgi:hypothetical protein
LLPAGSSWSRILLESLPRTGTDLQLNRFWTSNEQDKTEPFYFKIFSVIAACLIILTIQPANFRKPALSSRSPAQNFGKFKTDRKIFDFSQH